MIHSRCRDADLRSSFGSKLCPCLPAVKCNTGGRGNAFESTTTSRGGGGGRSTSATIVHNFHRERGFFPLGYGRLEALEQNSRGGISPPLLSYVLDSVGRTKEGGGEEEWRVVSIQMRKFRIYTARQAIISAGRFFARTFYRDRTNRGA